MKRLKRLLCSSAAVLVLLLINCQQVLAVTEAEVEAQVAAVGKEAVAGNVLVWFLCAVAFLKISQKIDSFMSSIGINVGHTGGSLMAEVMIAARGIGALKGFSSAGRSGGSRGSNGSSQGSGNSDGFLSGGLAGVVSRQVTEGAIQSTTSPANSSGVRPAERIGSQVYASSLANGGSFATNVIGAVATGNIGSMGSITGTKAAEALYSYLGYSGMVENPEDVPQFSEVEIGGGRITGKETSTEYPEGIAFGMYSTSQYAAPEGEFTKVYSADGNEWYKQYAVDAIERTPYEAPDGSMAFNESIIKKLPPVPRRKDRL